MMLERFEARPKPAQTHIDAESPGNSFQPSNAMPIAGTDLARPMLGFTSFGWGFTKVSKNLLANYPSKFRTAHRKAIGVATR
ncbi:MAG: hypothetical protein DMG60_11250 [Acidobacteria bacterium]|nr:MAG: hypothetical protein DMG60_11250 [Acidobacteriota bacterium]